MHKKKESWIKLFSCVTILLLFVFPLFSVPSAHAGTVPIAGTCDDYTFYLGASCLDEWEQVGTKLEGWGMNTVRLMFEFSSYDIGYNTVLNYDLMDDVLDVLYSHGVMGILDLHNLEHDVGDYFGSSTWLNDLTALATYYADDPRVYALEILNEPWAHGDAPYCGNWDLTNTAILNGINAVRAVDSDRIIIIPFMTFTVPQLSAAVLAKTNILVGYHCWSGYGQTLSQALSQISAYVTAFGSDRVWVGEFGTNINDQYFLTEIINACVGYNVGFNCHEYYQYQGMWDSSLSQSSYEGVSGEVDNKPWYGTHSVSTTTAGSTATFSCQWYDDNGLSQGYMSTNYTGYWVNRPMKTLSGKSAVFSDTQALPSQPGKTLAFRFLAQDNNGQWSVTLNYYVTTGEGYSPPNPPSYPPDYEPSTTPPFDYEPSVEPAPPWIDRDMHLTGSGFTIYFEQRQELAIQSGFTIYFNVSSGVWNGTNSALNVHYSTGRLSFDAVNDTEIYVFADVDYEWGFGVEGASMTSIKSMAPALVYLVDVPAGNHVLFQWNRHLPDIIGQNFYWALGLVGIIMMIVSPAAVAWQIRKNGVAENSTIEWIGYCMLAFIIGFGLLIIWLW